MTANECGCRPVLQLARREQLSSGGGDGQLPFEVDRPYGNTSADFNIV